MENIYALIDEWIESKQLPSAVIQVNLEGKVIGQKAFGDASIDTIFDIASLTKVTATLPALLWLEQSSQISFDDKLSTYLPNFQHKEVTILQCLQHRTGLPGSLPYPQNRYSTKDIWEEIWELPLQSKPGAEMRYSDIGMILAGKVVEIVSQQSLASFARKHVFQPLGMNDTKFLPEEELIPFIASTEWDDQKEQFLKGVVHDEVSFRLGGISGSAGLFSTASDLSMYAQAWLYPEQYSFLTPQTISMCTAEPVESRGLGWQVQDSSGIPLACGPDWPKGSFGHTGFTGTSMWIEPSSKLSVVFLTNAVHYGRNTKMVELRKQLHQEIFHSIMNK